MTTVQQDLKPEDYRHAVFLHLRPRPIIGLAGLLVLALFVFALVLKLTSPDPWDRLTFILLGGSVYLGVYFFVLIPRRANKSFAQNRFLKDHGECDIDDTGLHTRSDLGATEIPWDHLHKWKESKRMLLLYPTDTMYIIFPRRLFDAEGWEEFRELAGKNLKKLR